MSKGKVYIVGAGPGDPGLVTLKALAAIREADVVVYDYLVNEDILYLADQAFSGLPDGEGRAEEQGRKKSRSLVYAGKQGGDHTLSQEEINGLILREARQGKVVARLKGGDPFIFGRGGEEAEVLARAGVPYEIIPGVTSAAAVPAYAGIPLTHRNLTSTVAFVTGHEDPTKNKSDIDWTALAGMGTLVFLMGVGNLEAIVSSLRAAGKPAATPAALIRRGTTPAQETLTGTLEDIVAAARERQLRPPAIFIVGPVVSLRETLNWFETKPLFGKGVLITRPRAQAGELSLLLAAEGARPILFPTIEIVPPPSFDLLDRQIERLEEYAWIIFTSANGVRFFFRRLRELGRDIRDLKGIRIATIGPATARTIEAMGIRVDLVPRSYISEGVVESFRQFDLRGKKILLPRAEQARDVIPEELTRQGAKVEVVTVYRTVTAAAERPRLADLIDGGEVDVITFTSPSTVQGFRHIWGDGPLPPKVKIACLGPVTGEAAEKAGFTVDIMEKVFTIEVLVDGIKKYFANT